MRSGNTEFAPAGYRTFCSGKEETEDRQGLYGVGLAVKASICRKPVYTHQLIDERLMSMRVELTGECAAVNVVVAYAPTEAKPNTDLNDVLSKKLAHLVENISTKECLSVTVDDRTRRMEGRGDCRVLGAYGRDELNDNGKRRRPFDSHNKLALTNPLFSARKDGISHTFNRMNGRNDRKRILYDTS